MTSAPYLDNYLDSLDYLPTDLQRNLNLMRELDGRASKLLQGIDERSNRLLNDLVNDALTDAEYQEKVKNIQSSFNLANEYSEDKVQLATQSYELVDKYIRKLDINLSRFERDIQEKLNLQSGTEGNTEYEEQQAVANILKTISKNNQTIPSTSNKPSCSGVSGKKKLKQKTTGKSMEKENIIDHHSMIVVPKNAEVLMQMAVDPNEPVYCLCSQVSYGEMIGCDNVDCTIEWFHFQCVGLNYKPKGKWYCPNCILKLK